MLASSDYSVNTGTGAITFVVAPLLNDEIKVYAFTTDVSVFSLSALGIANHDKITVDSSGNLTLQGTIAMATNKITGLGNPTSAQDAATKTYVDTQIASQITLEDLDIEENTIIIFTSDNGGVVSGDHYSISNLPLKGGKGHHLKAEYGVHY